MILEYLKMKRFLKLSALTVTLILVGCAARQQVQGDIPARSIYTIPSVQAITMNGGSKITVIAGSSLNRVTSYGAPVLLSDGKNGTLTIKPLYYNVSPKNILVQVQRLSQVNFSNINNVVIKSKYRRTVGITLKNINKVQISGPLTISELNTKKVDNLMIGKRAFIRNLNLSDTGTGRLGGEIANVTINQSGSRRLDLILVNAFDVTVNATDNSVTKLGGSVRNLTANLDNSAVLDAKFFRAKKAFINTEDNARASVYVSNDLFAETIGTSSIYYFGLPKYVYKANSGQGVILPGNPRGSAGIPQRG